MVGKTKSWTKREAARRDDMLRTIRFCIRHLLMPGQEQRPYTQVHHLIDGNRRMGHWWTILLCDDCHDCAHAKGGYPVSEQRRHWAYIQHMLGLDDAFPASKIFKRRAA